jgi:hypothetical protein
VPIGCRRFDGSGLRCVFFDIIFLGWLLIVIKDHDIEVGFFHGTVIGLRIKFEIIKLEIGSLIKDQFRNKKYSDD